MHQNAIENVRMFPIEIAKTWVFQFTSAKGQKP
jgi:hypothetical protein